MGRRGRKRKAGPRQPDGRLKQDKPHDRQIDDRVRTSRQPHRRMLRDEDRLDERAESPLGRLLLKGYLGQDPKTGRPTEAAATRYDAGMLYAQVVGAYRALIEGPRSTAGSGRHVEPCDAEGCRKLERLFGASRVECHCRWAKERYDGAFEALDDQRVQKVLARVVIHGEAITSEDLVYLITGLDRLDRHFGLTAGRGLRHG